MRAEKQNYDFHDVDTAQHIARDGRSGTLELERAAQILDGEVDRLGAELDAALATMQGLHDQLIGGGPYPTFDEIARTLGAAPATIPAAHARVAELEAENAKLRTQRQHLSDWSGTSIAEIDHMYAAGELG